MRADEMKVTYKQIEIPAEDLQERLDDAFDLLFRETMKNFNNEVGEEETLADDYSNFILNNN